MKRFASARVPGWSVAVLMLMLAPAAFAHLDLVQSAPAADAALAASPAEIRLWFSDIPQTTGLSVRLADAAGALVAASEPASDPEDGRQVFIRPANPLAPGAYTVQWRALARDGHAMNGSFNFQVR